MINWDLINDFRFSQLLLDAQNELNIDQVRIDFKNI